MSKQGKDRRPVRWLSELGVDDVPLVGGKNASLGEMVSRLGAQGIAVPRGLCHHRRCLSRLRRRQ